MILKKMGPKSLKYGAKKINMVSVRPPVRHTPLNIIKTVNTLKTPTQNSQKSPKTKNIPLKTVKTVTNFDFCQSDN